MTDWIVAHWGRPQSNTARVAERIASHLGVTVCAWQGEPAAVAPPALLIVTANLGDGEIPEDVEWFVRDRCGALTHFGVVEIGNFYGFDDWGFGAAERIRRVLLGRSVREGLRPLSLDTLPQIDWQTLDRWCLDSAREDLRRE